MFRTGNFIQAINGTKFNADLAPCAPFRMDDGYQRRFLFLLWRRRDSNRSDRTRSWGLSHSISIVSTKVILPHALNIRKYKKGSHICQEKISKNYRIKSVFGRFFPYNIGEHVCGFLRRLMQLHRISTPLPFCRAAKSVKETVQLLARPKPKSYI